MTSTVVCISFDTIRLSLLCLRQCNALALSRLDNDRIEILLVAGGVRVAEESLCKWSVLFGQERGAYAIVPDVVVGVILLVADPYLCEPLYAATPNVSGDHEAQGIAVIGWQGHIVHLVGKNDIVCGIHCILQRDRCRILALARLVGSLEVDPVPCLLVLRPAVHVFGNPGGNEDVTEQRSFPVCTADCSRSPVGTFGLLDQIELFTSVAVASECDGDIDGIEIVFDIVHTQNKSAVLDVKLVQLPKKLCWRAVVPDVVQFVWSDEPGVEQM